MSVLIPDFKIYQGVATKMYYASFNKTCDINFFQSCASFAEPLTEEKTWNLVKCWLCLNEASYNTKYKEESNSIPLCNMLKEKFVCDAPNTYQFLKWLQCIRYNIERETIEKVRSLNEFEQYSLKFLERLIDEAKMAIIESLPQYKESTWSQIK